MLFCISGIYYYVHTIIRDPEFLTVEETDRFGQIESIYHDGAEFVIDGWCINPNVDTIQGNAQPPFRVYLKSETEDPLCYTAEYGLERPDIASYFNNNEHDYTYCGFQVRIPDTLTGTYEIALQQNERRPDTLLTGVLLHDGELQPSGLLEGITDIEGTDLQPIVEEGHLCASEPEYGMYVYQLGHSLYWIASEAYPFERGWGYLQYQPGTTQPEKLPAELYEAGYTYDRQEFYFENHELTQTMNCGPYRVAVMEIPQAYAVSRLETGYYENDAWIWRATFAPDYAALMNQE